jgi:hypothetical protein
MSKALVRLGIILMGKEMQHMTVTICQYVLLSVPSQNQTNVSRWESVT